MSKKIARDAVRGNVGVGRIAGGPKEPSYGPQFLIPIMTNEATRVLRKK